MNKKGFTLIELISVIVILALLVVIIVPTTSRVLKKSNQSVDKVTKNNVIAAARNWATDNKNSLPKSGSKIISVLQLQSLGYIDKNIKLASGENINEQCIKITNDTKDGGRPRYKYEYLDNCTGSSDLVLKATTSSGDEQPSGQCTNQNILMSVITDYQGSYSWQRNNTLISDVSSNNYLTKVAQNQEIKDTYKVLLNAEDGIHSATYVACVDKKAPDIKLTTAISETNNLTINLADNLSGLSGYAVTTSSETPTTWTSISGKSSQVIKSLAAGTYYVYAKDNAGNINSQMVEVPKIQFTLTYNYNNATGGNTQANKTVTYNQAYGTLPTPTRAYTVSYNSNGGSTASSATATYTFNGWYKESAFTNQVTSSTIYNINSNSTIYAKWTSSQVTLPSTTKTGYTFAGWYSDSALTKSVGAAGAKYTPTSNITLYAKFIDNIKPTKPNITNSSNGNWTNKNVVVTVTSTDAGSGIDHYEWYENGAWTTRALTTTNGKGTITYTAERNATIQFRAVDKAGNISDVSTTTVKIDLTPPNFTSITNSSGGIITGKAIIVNAKASDAHSGMDRITYKYSGNNTEYNDWGRKKTSTEVEGTWSAARNNELLVVAYDKVGNKVEKSAGKIHIVSQRGWINDTTENSSCKSNWWYIDADGSLHTGWLNVDGKWYYLAKADGKEGMWTSAQPKGCMMTGWVYSEDYTCATHGWYFDSSGAMVSSTTVDGYALASDGCWVNDSFILYGQKTCDGDCQVPGTNYWNDKLWRWWWTGASSGINRNSFYLNYSTEWTTNYCTYNANNLPYGSRTSCGYVQFNSGDIYYSRSYAKSSIVVHICTNGGICKDNTQVM